VRHQCPKIGNRAAGGRQRRVLNGDPSVLAPPPGPPSSRHGPLLPLDGSPPSGLWSELCGPRLRSALG